ncbi:MAG TPA: hypothetical protein VJT73_18015, partial [Polyangiaceae bacterium]|nr:hypothetical protein [Polyangiaceae bacterium]
RSISPKHDRLLLDFSAPFGLTLLANGARQRLVLAVTTARDAVYFAARLDLSERHALRHLLSFASTISDDDAVLDATAPDGAPLELRAGDLENLVRTLLAVSPGALDRCLLSDTRGAPVTLDGADLRIGRRGFDLRAPLEWRAMLFQEPFGVVMPTSDHDKSPIAPPGGIMVYQGTWVRQGACEVVLVSLMSSVSAAAASEKPDDGTTPEVASAVLRDLRLMQATPEPPPPFELRVGIERMYMLRLRAALDRAPRPSKADRLSASAR